MRSLVKSHLFFSILSPIIDLDYSAIDDEIDADNKAGKKSNKNNGLTKTKKKNEELRKILFNFDNICKITYARIHGKKRMLQCFDYLAL